MSLIFPQMKCRRLCSVCTKIAFLLLNRLLLTSRKFTKADFYVWCVYTRGIPRQPSTNTWCNGLFGLGCVWLSYVIWVVVIPTLASVGVWTQIKVSVRERLKFMWDRQVLTGVYLLGISIVSILIKVI